MDMGYESFAPSIEEIITELQSGRPLDPFARSHILKIARYARTLVPEPTEDWSVRDEANALTSIAFRHGFLEALHEGGYSPLLEDPSLSRITDDEMKRLMIECSATLARLLRFKEEHPKEYQLLLEERFQKYTEHWERKAETFDIEKGGLSRNDGRRISESTTSP